LSEFKLAEFWKSFELNEKIWLTLSTIIFPTLLSWISTYLYNRIFPDKSQDIISKIEDSDKKKAEQDKRIFEMLEVIKEQRSIDQAVFNELTLSTPFEGLTIKESIEKYNELKISFEKLSLKHKPTEKSINEFFENLEYQKAKNLIDKQLTKNKIDIAKLHYKKSIILEAELDYQSSLKEIDNAYKFNTKDSVILSQYGDILFLLAKYDKAIKYYSLSLEQNLNEFGEEHSSIASDYINIGKSLDALGEYEKAIDYFKKALSMDLNHLGELHKYVSRDYNFLGISYNSMRQFDEAINHHNKALEIELKLFGDNHPNLASIYNNLGMDWACKDNNEKAIEYFEKALAIDLKLRGEIHPNTAITLNNIAMAYLSLKKHKNSVEYFERALRILKVIYPTGHPFIDSAQKNLESAIRNNDS
tara:strand:+ start:1285 stop:2535 length:1251 start_codon:yes stop_codon:yes gene_type:complete